DYALLSLADRPGDQRGWVTLPMDAILPARDAPLMIVQHPDGAPMKLALDTEAVIGAMHGGLRLRYATNTEPGSSGSPCFGIDWQPVALHHMGDPAWQATYNQGVPLALIRAAIEADDKAGMLGA
ncbi:MAG: serine protease, partial [Pseudomonadota bacterium]|nr:serine protease [Pseudomonadota bacterium]